MWRWVFKPEILFFVGTAQSVLPLVLWKSNGPFPNYYYEISYIAGAIWITGYAAFWIGTKCAALHRKTKPATSLVRKPSRYAVLTFIVGLLILVQVALVTRVYGGIPFIQYLSGRSDAARSEELTLTHAFSGQLGLFLTSQLLLDGLIVVLLAAASHTRRYRLILLLSLVVALIAGLSVGKRQTVAIAMFMVACSNSVVYGNPVSPVLRYFGFRRPKWLSRALLIALPIGFVAFLGYIVRLRTGYEVTGRQQVLATLHIGLINLETQVAAVGYGPKEYDPLRLTQYLVPDRLLRRIDRFSAERPPRAEPTASAGFYGDLHWNTGLLGVITFSFFAGWISKHFYNRARSSLFHLLTYSLMSWTLIAAHSYNHFLHLNFLVLPAVWYWMLARLDQPARRYVLGRSPAAAPLRLRPATSPPTPGLTAE